MQQFELRVHSFVCGATESSRIFSLCPQAELFNHQRIVKYFYIVLNVTLIPHCPNSLFMAVLLLNTCPFYKTVYTCALPLL